MPRTLDLDLDGVDRAMLLDGDEGGYAVVGGWSVDELEPAAVKGRDAPVGAHRFPRRAT